MAIKIRSLKDGLEYEGIELSYIIDDEGSDIGEVYLDGTLLYQADDVISERQLEVKFKYDFVVDSNFPDELLGIESDKIDYNIDGVSSGLFTIGAEFMTRSGKEYIGDYHMHPKGGAMIGKFHDPAWTEKDHDRIYLTEFETHDELLKAREKAPHTNIDYTVDEDVYPHIGSVRAPIELTDDELLEEQRKVANKDRFGIMSEDELNENLEDNKDLFYGDKELEDEAY